MDAWARLRPPSQCRNKCLDRGWETSSRGLFASKTLWLTAASFIASAAVDDRNVIFRFCRLRRSVSMHRRIFRYELFGLAFLLLSHFPVAGGEVVTPLQTQSTSPAGTLVATDWTMGSTPGITDPLDFDQFNSKLGTLVSIDLTLTTTIRNDYILNFVPTPTETTLYVATSETSNPSVLSDPAQRALLTDGPTVTLYGPNGTTPIFGAPGTRQPVDFVSLTEQSGTWSSLLPATSPNFIEPTITTQSFSLGLTAANAPSLFSDFIGTGLVGLPVSAEAFSSFFSSSGNGGGAVLTKGNAVVTVQYSYIEGQVLIPEPSSAILFGLAVGIGIGARAWRRRPARVRK